MSRRKFDILKEFSNKVNDTFGAEEFKKLQSVINDNQREINSFKDISFEKQCVFLLQNSDYMNAMFIYRIDGYNRINRTKSKNIRFDNLKKAITGRSSDKEAVLVFDPLPSKDPIMASKFQVFSDDYIPEGAKIQYFISHDGINYSPITSNYILPKEYAKEGGTISVIANLYPSPYGEVPEIYNVAVLYYNKIVDVIYGLKDTDYSPIQTPEYEENETVLIRGGDGKVTAILDDFSITKLTRDSSNKISEIFLETNEGATETTTLFRETDAEGNEKVSKIRTEKGTVENVS